MDADGTELHRARVTFMIFWTLFEMLGHGGLTFSVAPLKSRWNKPVTPFLDDCETDR